MKTNWPVKKLEGADKDSLTISRDALLGKKRLLDAIDKLRQNAPKNQKVFETDCAYLAEATRVDQLPRLRDLLSSVENEKAASFIIYDQPIGGNPWGYDPVEITIGDNFENYTKEIREEYHKIDSLFKEEDKEINYWQITNPFWLLIQIFHLIFRFVKHHKIASSIALLISVLLIILRFLELDYSVILRNFLLVKEFIMSIL